VEAASVPQAGSTLGHTRGLRDRLGDKLFYGLTGIASLISVLLVLAIVWRILKGAWPAMQHFGLSFLSNNVWNATLNEFGARDLIIGTIVTSFGAIILSAPLSVAIALFLSEIAPPAIRGPAGTLIEMLAAVPSVVIGLWGIYVLAPF
jgi:phosphate transport system permease protein